MPYKTPFKNKMVFCNCDDQTWPAFLKYFHLNFAEIGLKKLISTYYDREEVTYKIVGISGSLANREGSILMEKECMIELLFIRKQVCDYELG